MRSSNSKPPQDQLRRVARFMFKILKSKLETSISPSTAAETSVIVPAGSVCLARHGDAVQMRNFAPPRALKYDTTTVAEDST